jgi:hypothetical protein
MVHMHRNPVAEETAYAGDTISVVPNKPKTPNRVIRVDGDLWRDYTAACEAEGVTRSDDLRAYMLRKVRAWKRRAARGPEARPEQEDRT